MSKPKFPKTLYVTHEDAGDGEFYFAAHGSPAGVVLADEEEEVGVYELVKHMKATAPTVLTEIKRR